MPSARIAVAASLCLLVAESLATGSHGTAVWAQSGSDDALRWSGAKSEVSGLLHSNGAIRITGSRNGFDGGAHWVSAFENNKDSGPNANTFDPAPVQVTVQSWPRPYSLTDYMPGGAAAVAAGSNYVDLSGACGGGSASLSFKNESLPGRLYWAPCDLSIDAKSSIGQITAVASGKIHLNVHKDSQLTSFANGVLALSDAAGNKAIHLNGNKSELHGDLIARNGEIHFAGSNQMLSCGVFGSTVKVSGSSLSIQGDDCGAPPPNTPPIAVDDSAETLEDTAVIIALLANDSDADGQLVPASVAVTTQPTNGSVVIDPATGDATYQPELDFFGTDAFSYTVADDDGATSQAATVTIAVQDFNDAPTATDDAFQTAEDTGIEVDVLTNDFDVDGIIDATTVTVVQAPINGTTVVDPVSGAVTYVPDPDYFGDDSFLYTVADDDGATSAFATATISVTPVNDAPVAQPDVVSGDEDLSLTLDLLANDTDVDDILDAGNVIISLAPTSGNVVVDAATGLITYIPALDFFGSDSFQYSLLDDGGAPSAGTALVSITIDPVNDAPVVGDAGVSVAEDNVLAVTLQANDVEDDPISYTIVDQPGSGSLSGTAPDLTYTPLPNFFGTDSFTYTASDGALDSGLATITITVLPVNDLPIIADETFTATEDTPLSLMIDVDDPDGDMVTVQVTVPPANGTVSGTGTDLQYVPDPDFNGTDSFTIVASDGTGSSGPATITIEVAASNDAPVATAQAVAADEDVSLDIILDGSDVDGDSLTFSVVTPPSNGNITGVAPDLVYTPDADFFGTDSFTFIASDGQVDSAPAAIDVSITAVNDAPTAASASVGTDEDLAIPVTLDASDVDGDSLSFSFLTQPSNGVLGGTAPDLIYTPNPDFNGTDAFTFVANDGQLDSPIATVEIAIAMVNDLPVADDLGIVTTEDMAVSFALTGSDVDGDVLSFLVQQGPASGTLSGTSPNLTYTPDPDFAGSDSFTYLANDGTQNSPIATVMIDVGAVNDAPTAGNVSVTTDEDTPVLVTLTGSDPEGSTLGYAIVTPPTSGTLSGTAPGLTYTPDPDVSGADTFTYIVNDGSLDSLPATVDITINPVNDAPVASAASVSTSEDTPLGITLTGSDVENDTLTFAVVTSPTSGSLSGTAPDLTYTPASDFSGSDSFTFIASDATLDSAPATISITVDAVDDAPVANDVAATTDEDIPVAIVLDGSDPEGATLSYVIVSGPTSGTLSGTAPNLTYTPAADANGADSFTYLVNDGVQDSNIATASITINAIDDAPFANPQSITTDEDTPVAILLTGSDPEGATLNFTVTGTGPTSGTLSGDAPNLTYTPDADFAGTDGFTFIVNDGNLDSPEATVSITVNAVNDPPVADPNAVITLEDTDVGITLSGTDSEGAGLTFNVTVQPGSGTLSGVAPNLTYSPNANFFGADSLTFVVNDGTQDSAPAQVDITVTPVNDLPVASDITVNAIAGQAVQVVLAGSDDDNDPLTFAIASQPSDGALSGPVTDLFYTADLGFSGTDSFTFTADDGSGPSAPATVTLQVTDNNNAPTIDSTPITQATRLSLYNYQVTATDVDGDTLNYALLTAPTGMTISAVGLVEWTPDTVGSFDVVVEVADGNGGSAQQAYTIDVVDNSPPNFTQIPLLNAPLGETYRGTGAAVDPDGGAITFALTAGPTGSDIVDLGNGDFRIEWLSAGNVGDTTPFTITATDPSGASSTLNLGVIVTGPRVNNSHLGTDFWLGFGANFRNFSFSLGQMPANDPGRSLQVVIGAPEGATGTVEAVGVAGIVESFTIAPGGSATIDLPTEIMAGVPAFQDAIRRPDGGPPGVRVLSDLPITVAGVNWAFATTDAWLALPANTLGTQYTITGYRDDLFQPNNEDTFWGLVGTVDNTTVTITPLEELPLRVNQDIFDPQVYTVNAGQVLTGSLRYAVSAEVVADQPIAMFGGSSCADVPIGIGTCDHLWQQFVPTTSLASNYLAAPLETRTASFYRVIADQDDTRVFINGVYSAFLNRGENVDVTLPGPVSISGSRPITAVQYAIGNQFDNADRQDELADPFMLNLAPVDAFLTEYTVVIPGGEGVFRDQPNNTIRPPIENFYISVVLPTSQADSLYLDGALVDTAGFEPVPDSDYLAGALPVTSGTHNLAANEQFGVTVYGWGLEESYGHYAGLIFPDGSTNLIVSATGPSVPLVAGSEQACIDITVTDTGGARVPRARYTLDITGTVPRTHTGFVDRVGEAQFCYTQAQAGTDNVTVAVAGDSAILAVNWLPNSDPGTNGAPEITSFPDLVLYEQTFTYPIASVDPDGDIVGYSVTDAPNGVTIVNGVLSWTPVIPADREPTTHLITLVADDGNGGTDEQSFELKVYYPAIFVENFPFTSGTQLFSRRFGTTFDHIGGDPDLLVSNMIEGSGDVRWAGVLGTTPVFNVDGRTQFIQQRQYTDEHNLMCRAEGVSTGQIRFNQVWNADLFGNIRLLVAGPVLDTNNDLVVNDDDDIYAVLAEADGIVLFNLTTQQVAWEARFRTLSQNNYVALANLDADVDQEILAVHSVDGESGTLLTAYDADGTRLWRSTHNPFLGDFTTSTFEMPILPVDLDNNGVTEIILGPYVYDNNGNVLWQFDDTRIGSTRPRYAMPLAVDLDNDGAREVLFANEVRDTDGTLLWSLPYSIATRRPQVFYAVGDLTGDSDLEIVASISTENGTFTEAFSADGQSIWPSALTGISFSMPVVTDFDRDGDIDVFLPASRNFISADGVLEANDGGGASYNIVQQISDLDQDGIPERMLYSNSWRLEPSEIFSSTRWGNRNFQGETNNFSTLRVWQPAVWVDPDHDGETEMFVAGVFGTALYESAGRPFPGMTRRYSQVVDFDQPVIGFDTDFGTPTNPGFADAWVGRIRFDQLDEQNFTLSAEVTNKGLAPIDSPVTVRFFSGRTDGTGTLIGEVTLPDLPVNAARTASIPATYDDRDFVMSAQLVFDPSVFQCDINNDAVEGELHTIEMRDGDTPYRINRYSYLHQEWYANRDVSVFNSPTNTTITLGQTYTFDIDAGWGDAESSYGNSIIYRPSTGTLAAGMSVNALTGEISWTPTFADVGTNSFSIDIDSVDDSTTSNFTIEVVPRANEVPVITTAPPGGLILDGETFSYDVDATDADNDVLTYALTVSPAGMTIDAASGLIAWAPGAGQVGLFPVTVTADDAFGGVASQSFSVQVGVTNNTPPDITSTPPFTAKATFELQYQVVATDVDGDFLAYSIEEGPAGMTIDGSGLLSWTPAAAGLESVRIRVNDGQAFVDQSWTLQVVDASIPLQASLSVDPNVAELNSFVDLTVGFSGAAGPVSISLNVDGVAVPVDPATGIGTYLADSVGVRTATAIVSDPYDSDSAIVQFSVIDSSSGSNPPTVTLVTPDFEQEVTAPIDAIGTVDDPDDDLQSWRLVLQSRGADPTEFTTIATGTTEIPDDVIAQIDPTVLLNGLYSVILEATDNAGNTAQDVRVIRVSGDLKIGNFSITIEDFSAPVAGIPVTVERIYDTRRRTEDLDFGFGWSIDYQNVRVQESRDIGFSWTLVEEDLGIFSQWCVRPNGDPTVTVRMPDGEIETFVARAQPECTPLVPTVDVNIVFEPRDFTDTSLEQTDFGVVRIVGNNIVDLGQPGVPIDPTNYRLTTPDGFIYELDQSFGVRRVTDSHGNTLTYSDAGIVHSQGFSLDFVRDGTGRITDIVAPDGTRMTYAYDANGDLESFTDQVNNVTGYTYTNTTDHYLEDIIDGRGIIASRNEYDTDGRLIATIDADGNRIELTHDVAGRTEIVRDRRGNRIIYLYDDDGNILSETNELIEVIARTFDADRNMLSMTDGVGNTTSWTYDDRKNMLSETDGLLDTTLRTYDDRNLALTVVDPAGVTVLTNVYNSGNTSLLSVTDALGNTTTFDWDTGIGAGCSTGANRGYTDPLGNPTVIQPQCVGPFAELPAWEDDPRGIRTSFVYDDLGRPVSETTTRTDENGVVQTLTTLVEYDDKGRVVAVTDPENNVTRFEFNEIDQETAIIDPNLNRTEFEYDDRGNLVLTRYADGTTETIGYDEEENKVSMTDRLGRTTRMTYDAAHRLLATIHPDSTPGDDSDNPRNINEYDAAGRLVATIDELGNRTEHEYDAANRKVLMRDALGQVTRFEYDERGFQTAVIDALGRRMEIVYDDNQRVVETIFPDDTPADPSDNLRASATYDAMDRKTSATDLGGITTQYEFDENGNLVAVVDPYGRRTEQVYDEQNNRIQQIDAAGRVTLWAYDDVGRVTSRTLPEGQTESFSYDANGNRVGHVDFNSRSHTFIYDEMDREVSAIHADGITVTTVYSDVGLVLSVTDERGVTSHIFDERDRLTSIANPDGRTISYSYDAASNRTRLETANQVINYTFDGLNRLENVTDRIGTSTYDYDAVGNIAGINYANGTRAARSYDTLNRLLEVSQFDSSDVLFDRHTYTLDPNGNRLDHTELGGRVATYTYDDLYLLLSEAVSDPNVGARDETYTYDAVGNRQSVTRANSLGTTTTTYTFDGNDRLLSETAVGAVPSAVSYTYDDIGNQIGKTDGPVTTTYSYDSRNRMISVDSGRIVYEYDASGIRQSRTESLQTRSYLVDPNRQFSQVLEEQIEGAPFVDVSYTYGIDLIAQHRRIDATSTLSDTYHYDGIGSTRSLTSETGVVSDRYAYTAFGELEDQFGSTPNSYLYAGEQYDDSLQKYYLRARYYDPGYGRFDRMDEWAGLPCTPITLNKYIYANGNPVSNIDPSGFVATNTSDLTASLNSHGITTTTSTSSTHLTVGVSGKVGGRKIAKKITCEIGVAYIKKQYVGDGNEGHHPISQNLGGANDQALIFLPAETHRMFHWVLHVMLKAHPEFAGMGNWTSAANWETISQTRAGRRALYEVIFRTSQLIDKACGLKRGRRLAVFVRINRQKFLRE